MVKVIVKSSIIVIGYLIFSMIIDALFSVDQFGNAIYANKALKFLICVLIGVVLAHNSFKIKKWEKKNWAIVVFMIVVLCFSAVIILEPLMLVEFGTSIQSTMAFLTRSNITSILGIVFGFQLSNIIFE